MIRSAYPWRLVAALMAAARLSALSAQQGVARASNEADLVDNQTANALWSRSVNVSINRQSLGTVLRAIAISAGVHIQYDEDLVAPYVAPVTLQARHMTLRDALAHVLAGTHLIALPLSSTSIVVSTADSGQRLSARTGIVQGKVTDGKTRRPVKGASISIDGMTRGVVTDDDGMYHLAGVTVGPHTVMIKDLGYTRQTRQIMVVENTTLVFDVVMEPSASQLDQVVVTGTVAATELRAVPNAMTVITAKQIEERGIVKIDQLFRGDVPGLFAQDQGSGALLDEVRMFSRGATAFEGGFSAGADRGTNPIKTYIDGVELADPKYLSQIDPKSIERIEILTGPQASTIYGSNAINGVMQIFTKRGMTSKPQLTLNLLSGFVQNNFSSALTPQHDYSAQLSGIEGRISYNAGGSWNYVGAWTPAKQTARTSVFGGTRLDLPTSGGRVTADMTLRNGTTQNQQRGNVEQAVTGYREFGWYSTTNGSGLSQPTTSTLTGQTLGLVVGYTPTSWWSHEFGIGQDASNTELRVTARGYVSVSDTALQLSQTHTDKHSLRYTTTTHVPIASLVQATVTAGADAWQSLTSSVVVFPQTLTGSLTGSTVRRQPGHNTGAFVQTQLGMKDRLFLTYGLRAEWNPNYGTDAQPNYAPRYGVAYTEDIGSITAKLRGSYGRSTRPPAPGLKVAVKLSDPVVGGSFAVPDYGNIDYYLGNPDLAPEHQQGGEGGVELYLGTRGSLVITRYNQTVDGLIAQPVADSARSLVINPTSYFDSKDAQGYGYIRQTEYLNIGTIRNQGWELQGSLSTGSFTTQGTYSWTKSRTIGVNPKYRAFFTPARYPQYQPGATFKYLPEHTWAIGMTYVHLQTTVGLNITGLGRAMNSNDDFFYQSLTGAIRLPQNRPNLNFGIGYINFNRGYALADLTASHWLSSSFEGVLQVQNLTDHYTNDYGANYATMGRQVKAGLRLRL